MKIEVDEEDLKFLIKIGKKSNNFITKKNVEMIEKRYFENENH